MANVIFFCLFRTKENQATTTSQVVVACTVQRLCVSHSSSQRGVWGGRGRWVSRETERWWLVNTVSNRAHNWSSRLTKPKPRPEALLHVTLYKAQPNRLVKHRAALWIETGWRGSAQIKQNQSRKRVKYSCKIYSEKQKKKLLHIASIKYHPYKSAQTTGMAVQTIQQADK